MAMVKFAEFLSIDLAQMLMILANLLIMFLILKHFLFDKVNKIFEERKNDVESAYKKADEAQEKAEKLEAEYTHKISNAKEESAQIVRNATKKAQLRSDEIIADAKTEAKGIVDSANAEIEREKKIAVNQIKDEITEIAISAASAVVEKEISRQDNERLIESFIDNVGDL